MNLKAFRKKLAVDLNDAAAGHEMTTWTESQLGDYVAEALHVMFQDRPDLFVERRILEVSSYNPQDMCDCTKIERVLGECNAQGSLLRPLRKRSNAPKLAWTGPVCKQDSNYFQLREYSIEENGSQLWVFPEVPAGTSVYILVECVALKDRLEDTDDISPPLMPAVTQWVLWRAKMVDGENNAGVTQIAVAHKRAFWELVYDQRREGRPTNVRATAQGSDQQSDS